MVSAIVCVDRNWGIGYQGELLSYIPEDMRFFTEKTKNGVVIMGRKTYDSLSARPLPNRINIVVTSHIDSDCKIENNVIFVTINFIKLFLGTLSPDNPMEYYVIGGGQIYRELLPYCNTSYVTKVNHAYRFVDTYFPNLDDNEEWEIWREENNEIKTYRGTEYMFCTYENTHL